MRSGSAAARSTRTRPSRGPARPRTARSRTAGVELAAPAKLRVGETPMRSRWSAHWGTTLAARQRSNLALRRTSACRPSSAPGWSSCRHRERGWRASCPRKRRRHSRSCADARRAGARAGRAARADPRHQSPAALRAMGSRPRSTSCAAARRFPRALTWRSTGASRSRSRAPPTSWSARRCQRGQALPRQRGPSASLLRRPAPELGGRPGSRRRACRPAPSRGQPARAPHRSRARGAAPRSPLESRHSATLVIGVR